MPVDKRKRGARRRCCSHRFTWALTVSLAALLGLGEERHLRLCAGELHLDPWRNALTAAAFLLTALAPLLNEVALRRRWARLGWPRVLALAVTALALPIAAATGLAFLPALPLSPMLVPFFGVGILLWAPYGVVAVLVVQAWQLLRQARPEAPLTFPGRVLLAALPFIAASTGALVIHWGCWPCR